MKSQGDMNVRFVARGAQRGHVLWVLLGLLTVLVIGAWKYGEYRSEKRQIALEAAAKQAQQARAEQERKVLEERLAKEKAERDALTTSLKAFDGILARWNDAVKVASTTGRISLSGPVAALQAIRREAEQIVPPPCLDAGKAELIKSMESTEKGFLAFMRNELKLGEVLAKIELEEAEKSMAVYKQGRESCPASTT